MNSTNQTHDSSIRVNMCPTFKIVIKIVEWVHATEIRDTIMY